ncbi:hypothetical protein MTO96_010342 [Rhipicephalus appendiculatus]
MGSMECVACTPFHSAPAREVSSCPTSERYALCFWLPLQGQGYRKTGRDRCSLIGTAPLDKWRYLEPGSRSVPEDLRWQRQGRASCRPPLATSGMLGRRRPHCVNSEG